MSNMMDWIKNTLGMNDEEQAGSAPEEEIKQNPTPLKKRNPADDIPIPPSSPRKSKVVNINTTTQLKVVVVQPISYNDASEIAIHLKSKKPVVVNLEKLDKKVAPRIIDFLSGAVFALDGSMKKVSSHILLVVPNTIGIMGDFCDELTSPDLFDFI